MGTKKKSGKRKRVRAVSAPKPVARKTVQAQQAERALRDCEERFRDLVELASDWYWEQDEHFRFTSRYGKALGDAGFRADEGLGKTRWELPYLNVTEQQWAEHKATLAAHKPFYKLELCRADDAGQLHWMSINGRPMFDQNGKFKGYRGTATDITEQRAREDALLRFRAAIDATADAIHIVDYETMQFVDVNRTACIYLGYTREEFLDLGIVGIAPEADVERLRSLYAQLFDGNGAHQSAEIVHRHKSGALIPVEINRSGTVVNGRRIVVNVLRDISERKKEEAALRESEARFRDLTELSSDWFWEMGPDLKFTDVRGGSRDSDIYTSQSHNGKYRWELPYVDTPEETWTAHKADLAARRAFHDLILKRRRDDGSIGTISISGKPIFDNNGVFVGYRGIGKDISERALAQERIEYLATHDNLTDLPNRAMFSEMLNLAIATASRYQRRFALLFIDLDRFKNINDTFGHETGDLLLKEMSRRLVTTLRSSDVVARLGGDEFVVLVQEVSEETQVAGIARKMLSAVIRPLVLLEQECRVTASIGIAMYPKDAQDEKTLMKNADIAMYRAKEEGKNNFQFYSEQMNVHTLERMALETSLRRAIERNELSLHYQAKQDLKSGKITGVEALLRWAHPDLGMISPAQFIPLAEETGLIIPIGRWVLRTACTQNVAWQKQGLPPVCMAINLSPRQFADDELANDIDLALRSTGLRAELLELELTEGMIMQNPERAIKVLGAIKSMGVRLAIDDFGVGYSSLAQIKRFPIDTLKVDRSFIRDIPQVAEDNAITEAIINMGRTLSLTVIAEGVETQEQKTFLSEHNCDQMQGFFFSRPIAAEQFAEFLRKHTDETAEKK